MLCKNDGVLNFIMPVKWTNSAFGKGLRKIMSEKKAAHRIISFSAYQVFNASTYTGLQWFKRNSSNLYYAELDRDLVNKEALRKYLNALVPDSYNKFRIDEFSEESWVLTDVQIGIILDEIANQPKKVSDVFEKFFTGLQTSKDSVYFLLNSQIDGDYIEGYSSELEKTIRIEKGLLKPLLKGDQVHRYVTLSTNNYVIFPYKIIGDKAILFSESEIKNKFPLGYHYLKENENSLRMRENGKLLNDDFWFRYIYPKNLTLFRKSKIVGPDISLGGNYSIDIEGEFYDTTTLYGYIKYPNINTDYRFLLSILNSKVCWFFLKNTGTVLANGYFRYMPRYVNEFHLALPPNKLIEDALVNLVDYVFFLKNPINEQISHTVDNEHIAHFFEDIIDGCVFELYFEKHMHERDIEILSMVSSEIKSIEGKREQEAGEVILNTWLKMRKSEIAEKMRSFTVKSPDILKPIIQS